MYGQIYIIINLTRQSLESLANIHDRKMEKARKSLEIFIHVYSKQLLHYLK